MQAKQIKRVILPSRDLYRCAVDLFGPTHQKVIAMEEMSELTKELSKSIRGAKNIEAVVEEIADVEIMLAQLKVIFDCHAAVDGVKSEKLRKLKRTILAEKLCLEVGGTKI